MLPDNKNPNVIVLAKAPIPGTVKTRLQPALDAPAAAALHERMVAHTLATATAFAPGRVQLWCAPDCSHPFFADCARRFDVSLHDQYGADLGERMYHALRHALLDAPATVLIGTDAPALRAGHLERAVRPLLQGVDAAFAPTEDGGYCLIGVRQADRRLFDHVLWGTEAVMIETRERLRALDWSWLELDTLWDVDTPEDLGRLVRLGLLERAPQDLPYSA